MLWQGPKFPETAAIPAVDLRWGSTAEETTNFNAQRDWPLRKSLNRRQTIMWPFALAKYLGTRG